MKSFAVVYCLLIAKITALPITQLSGLEGPSPLENEVDDSESFIDVLHINENKGETNTPTDITTKTITDIWNDNNFANEVSSTTSDSSETDSPFKKNIGFGLQEYTTTYSNEIRSDLPQELHSTTEKHQTNTEIYEETSEKTTEIKETEEKDDNNSEEDSSSEKDNASKSVSSDESESSSSESSSGEEDKDDCVPSNCDGVSPVYASFDALKETQTTPLDASTNSNIGLVNRFGIAASTTEYVSPTFGHFTSNIVTTPEEILDTDDISTTKSIDGNTENEISNASDDSSSTSTSEVSSTQKNIDITTYRPATVKNVEIIVGNDPPTTYTPFLPTTQLLKSAQLVDTRFSNNLRNEISNSDGLLVNNIETTAVISAEQLESRTGEEHPVPFINTFTSEPTTERFINGFTKESSGLSIFSKFANTNFGYNSIQPEKKKDFPVNDATTTADEENKDEVIEPAVFNGVFSFGDSFGKNRFPNYATPSTTTTKPGSFGSIFNTIAKRYQSPYKYSWSFSSTAKSLPDNSDKEIFSKSFLNRLTSSTTESFIKLDTINLGNTGSIQRKTGGEIADYKGLRIYNPSVGKYL